MLSEYQTGGLYRQGHNGIGMHMAVMLTATASASNRSPRGAYTRSRSQSNAAGSSLNTAAGTPNSFSTFLLEKRGY